MKSLFTNLCAEKSKQSFTVGENIIATTKIPNNYGAIEIIEKLPFLKGKKKYFAF